MRRFPALLVLLALVLAPAGCVTAYKAAVDVRDVKTIAADARIKAAIIEGYILDDEIKALDITVNCYEGEVYLVGVYESVTQKEKAVAIARGTEGVKGVVAHFLPKMEDPGCGARENIEVAARVRGRLIKDGEIWSTNVDVKAVRCHVVLTGLVRTRSEISRAVSHAKGVEGARSVTSYLKAVE